MKWLSCWWKLRKLLQIRAKYITLRVSSSTLNLFKYYGVIISKFLVAARYSALRLFSSVLLLSQIVL